MADFVTKKTCESAIEGPLKTRRAENGFLYSFIQQRLQDVRLDVAGVYSPDFHEVADVAASEACGKVGGDARSDNTSRSNRSRELDISSTKAGRSTCVMTAAARPTGAKTGAISRFPS
ncbi:hypothetical protein Emag_004859 [Eimeria magna]